MLENGLNQTTHCAEQQLSRIDETILVASKVAVQYKLTNSVIVNALKKLESAGILETKSLGMKGTYIRILNPFLRETVGNAEV